MVRSEKIFKDSSNNVINYFIIQQTAILIFKFVFEYLTDVARQGHP